MSNVMQWSQEPLRVKTLVRLAGVIAEEPTAPEGGGFGGRRR
jgi:hypothetical protein